MPAAGSAGPTPPPEEDEEYNERTEKWRAKSKNKSPGGKAVAVVAAAAAMFPHVSCLACKHAMCKFAAAHHEHIDLYRLQAVAEAAAHRGPRAPI